MGTLHISDLMLSEVCWPSYEFGASHISPDNFVFHNEDGSVFSGDTEWDDAAYATSKFDGQRLTESRMATLLLDYGFEARRGWNMANSFRTAYWAKVDEVQKLKEKVAKLEGQKARLKARLAKK